MANKTSSSSVSSFSPSSGATDSLWQPSWLHWKYATEKLSSDTGSTPASPTAES